MNINETFQSENSTENLGILLEGIGDNMSNRVQKWAVQSQTMQKANRFHIKSIIAYARRLLSVKFFGKLGGDIRIPVDVHAYTKLAKFIEKSNTYRIANFSAQKVASYGKNINIINNPFGMKAEVKAVKLNKLYSSMTSEMRSRKARALSSSLNDMRLVEVRNEMQYAARVAPVVKNLLSATKQLNALVETMGRSFRKLLINIDVLIRKRKMDFSSNYNRTQKNDLISRCLSYVAYANKLLVTMCSNALEKIDHLMAQYKNIFTGKDE